MITFYFGGSFADAESKSLVFDNFDLSFRQYLRINHISVKFRSYVQGENLIFTLECSLKTSVKIIDYFQRNTIDSSIYIKSFNYVI